MCSNNDLWVFVKIHATYTQSGWTRSELAMHITRPVSRMGIIVRGRFSAGLVLASQYPEWQGRASQPRGDLLQEDVSQTQGNKMVPLRLVSFSIDRCLGVSRSCWLASG